jgi:cytoskeletal protein RodZ
MALFNRKKEKTIAELENYYAQQNKSKGGAMAWFMAILSLFITIAVISLLFFGGRWLYRTLTSDSDTTQVTSNESNNTQNQTESESNSTNENSASTNNSQNQGVVSDEAASTNTGNAGTTGATSNTPAAGALPNTGPDMDL